MKVNINTDGLYLQIPFIVLRVSFIRSSGHLSLWWSVSHSSGDSGHEVLSEHRRV